MNLYLIRRTDNYDYDEYTEAVVVAESAAGARRIHPGGADGDRNEWTGSPGNVVATLIGTTHLPAGTVVLASYLAG